MLSQTSIALTTWSIADHEWMLDFPTDMIWCLMLVSVTITRENIFTKGERAWEIYRYFEKMALH